MIRSDIVVGISKELLDIYVERSMREIVHHLRHI